MQLFGILAAGIDLHFDDFGCRHSFEIECWCRQESEAHL